MALTRKMLAAMDIPAEKIDEIITAHTETVNALKEERDNFKTEADGAKDLTEKLRLANEELDKIKGGDWEKKYTDLKQEYDTFKSDVQNKEVKGKKETAYRDLLVKAGVSEKRIASVMKVSSSSIDELSFDDKGEIKDADKILDSVKKEWADFISTTGEKGADVDHHPKGEEGGEKLTRGAQLAAKYYENLYGKQGKES